MLSLHPPARVLSVLAAALLSAASPARATLTLLDTIRLNDPRNGHEPWGIASCPAGDNRVYVACLYGPGHLMVLDAMADTVLARGTLTGPYPHGIEVNAGGDRAYVASSGGTVSIVDAQTLEELHVTSLGGVLIDLCLYEPMATMPKVYVVDMYDARARVLDAASGAWMHDIPVGNYPYDLCAIAARDRVYVANLSDWTVSVIDAVTDRVVATIPVGAYPEGIAADPVLNLIYVANRDDNTVSVINGASNQVIASYPTGTGPVKIAVDPTTHRVFVVNQTSQDVTVLSPEGPLGYTEPVGLTPRGGVCVDPSLGRVFVTNLLSDDVTAFAVTPTGCGSSTIRLRFDPGSVAVSRPLPGGLNDTPSLIVGNNRGNDADHLDLATDERVWRYPPGYVPTDVAARPSDGRAAAVVANADALYVLDDASGAVIDTIPVGDEPKGLCIRSDMNRAYVANWASHDLSVVDLDSAGVIETVEFTWGALDVAVDEGLNKIFVTTWFGLLCVIDGATHEILDTISLSDYCELNQLAVDRLRHRVYVAALNCPVIWEVDGWTHEIGPALVLPDYGTGVAVAEPLQRIYVPAGPLLVGIGPEFEVKDILSLPGAAVRCDVDPSSRQVLVSGIDEYGGVVFRVLDGEPGAVGEDHDPDGWAAGKNRDRGDVRLSLLSANPACLGGGSGACGAGGDAVRLGLATSEASPVRVGIFDVAGALVRWLGIPGPSTAGGSPRPQMLHWRGDDAAGRAVPAGVYLIRAVDRRGSTLGTSVRVTLVR
jgi:YVTN family beta-propeller protein